MSGSIRWERVGLQGKGAVSALSAANHGPPRTRSGIFRINRTCTESFITVAVLFVQHPSKKRARNTVYSGSFIACAGSFVIVRRDGGGHPEVVPFWSFA